MASNNDSIKNAVGCYRIEPSVLDCGFCFSDHFKDRQTNNALLDMQSNIVSVAGLEARNPQEIKHSSAPISCLVWSILVPVILLREMRQTLTSEQRRVILVSLFVYQPIKTQLKSYVALILVLSI